MRNVVFVLTLIPAGALAQSHTEHPHEHGFGSLKVAFSGTEIALSLAVPSADIVGFERPAETDEGRALVANAISDLSKPLELFAVSQEAGCFTTSANVTLSSEGFGRTNSNTLADEQVNHIEFQADYQIQCQDMDALKGIQFAFFDRFPMAKKLIVRVDRPGGSRAHDITRIAPNLTF